MPEQVEENNPPVAPPPKSVALISKNAQIITALTPLVAVVVSILSLAFTVLMQGCEARRESQQKEDADWRLALERISFDRNSAILGEFEMQSFLKSEKHSKDARTALTLLLPMVPYGDAFDAVLPDLRDGTDAYNQVDLVLVDRSIANKLRDEYDKAKKLGHVSTRHIDSLQNFVEHPEDYYNDDDSDSELLKEVIADTYKLDSISDSLSRIWGNENPHGRIDHPTRDLSGIIVLNHDFRQVDFRQVDFNKDDATHVLFFGRCQLDPKSLPSGLDSNCHSE